MYVRSHSSQDRRRTGIGLIANDEFLEQFDRGVGDEPEPDPSRVLRGSSVDSGDRAVPKGPLVLHGAAVTPHGAMSSAYVLVDGGKILSVTAEDPGAGEPWETNGVIVPGLIDMHNHPNYNVFAAWEPPKLYQHRAAWRGSDEYDVRSSTAPLPSKPKRRGSSSVTRRNCGPTTSGTP